MSLIHVSNLTFAYEGSYENIFEQVSFDIDTSWKLGFTGRNGRGKTTFLKLLAGEYEYGGVISASVSFDYFPFPVEHPETVTRKIVEPILAELGEYEGWRLERELSLLELSESVLDRPFSTLSNGEQTKVLLAALFLRENHFLLIDEPTNHLDMEGRRLVSRYLRGKKGFILVSHDRDFLDGCVDHILSINRSGIEVQKGNFSSWQENRKRRDQFELSENEKRKKEIRQLAEAAKRTERWSDKIEKTKSGKTRAGQAGVKPDKGFIGAQSARMMKRSKALENRQQSAVEEKQKLLKDLETAADLSLSPLHYHGQRLIEVNGLSLFYGERQITEDVSFTVERGERIALTGGNGCGKSSILKLIMGEDIAHSGTVRRGTQMTVSYIPQDTSGLSGGLKDFAYLKGLDESLFKALLRKLDFSRTQFEKDMSEFSAGQKKKVLLAASLCQPAHLYIWDEPLNYIDVLSRMQIEEAISRSQPTMIFVEHDSAFCHRAATKILRLPGCGKR
ncbi:ribosomal protection-like ABC-F family protein [Bacilliculturomica massiliensis]|uniref:ribosomal protection-like ABC-F family protein n=1 Tax=Bacilliculturomica massiliensis TaxID=1917867 RepID=UPI0010312881|nr:ABC-F type ribosomal protection protein [Bacilliculturomica massiliensis]